MSKSIGRYVSSLLPSFEKSRIEEDIRVLKEELTDNTLPPYQASSEHFKSGSFHSKETKQFDQMFSKSVKIERSFQGLYPVTIFHILSNSLETLNLLEGQLDKYFGRDVASGAMTYSRANFLRLIELIGFTSKYSRRLLLWTYNEEKKAHGRTIGQPFTKAEYDWLFNNRHAFLTGMNILAKKPKELLGVLANIPDMIVVPEETDVAEQTVGSQKLDPLKMGIIPIVLNPVYHIGMAIAEFQVARYKAGVEERRSLEYRLLALKELTDGKEDARLEQQIEYTENRIKKLNHKLAKMEEG